MAVIPILKYASGHQRIDAFELTTTLPMTFRPLSVLRELQKSELNGAAQLLGRGMCDNPVNVRAFGIENRERRVRAMSRFFLPVLEGLYRRGLVIGAFNETKLVGVCGMARPQSCQPRTMEKFRVLPKVVLGNPIVAPLRVLKWVGEWARRDPKEPHWHLGPVAVDSGLRGRGIGGAMLTRFCAAMDEKHELAYLETDKSENVHFYQRFGFSVIAEGKVLGIINWFMLRSRL
jgi:ribosomal protein S18 acetylase RimI-like enzyme